MKYFLILLATSTLLVNSDAQAQSRHINLTGCNVWPNERSDYVPALAIDRSTDTYTWSTQMYNTQVARIGIAFEQPAEVTRIRIWKDDDGTGWPTPVPKDLTIYVSNDEGPLAQRTWMRVSGLMGGFGGAEAYCADSISTDGFVWGDRHDSVNEGHGWGSLVFNPALATGVCIQFANSAGATTQYVHYKLHEIEAYALGSESTSITSWGLIKSLYR
jgi:hypothetical protein